MTTTDIHALQALPETQPLRLPGLDLGTLQIEPCTYTCGGSCTYTCDVITCRYGWTCAQTSS